MDSRPYKHDFRALPSVPGLRQRPSCRVADFLVEPMTDDTLFSLIGEATFRRKGEALTRTIQALISLRGKRRLSRTAIATLRAFQPMHALINHETLRQVDAMSLAVWRHNAIVRMAAGQRTVWETMRLLRIAPVQHVSFDSRIVEAYGGTVNANDTAFLMWAAYEARPADDMPF